MRPAAPRFPFTVPRPTLRSAALAVLAVLSVVVTVRATSRAEATVERYGPPAPAVVAVAPVPAGTVLDPSLVRVEQRPAAMQPAGALDALPVGRTTRVPLVAGEVLAAHHLAGPGASATAALIPDGWRALAVPTLDARPPVVVGDSVDVHVTLDPLATTASGAVVVAASALVVAADDEAVTVAVPADLVDEVAYATASGIVTLALVP